ncbi:MAG: M23 family metallopeptidase [Bacteroidales bacterium]|jgi:hypothetical protein|nr:M23 family metallopeptidase [Bacteroidales bacterium]
MVIRYNVLHVKLSVFLYSVCILWLCGGIKAQNYPQTYFSSPLDIPLYASGNFAEIRSGHFHSGQDIRTNEKTGYPVYSPADGYVSRIKVQIYGGGKNLYITHPNGYTTVYMHLERYAPQIEEYLKEYQYKNHRYELDISLNANQIQVQKGATIAYTGNSGGSAGPHLHYEIRNTANQQTINPLLFALPIEDTSAPYFAAVMVKGDDYVAVNKPFDTITASGEEFYFCIEAYDRSNGSTARNGVYSTEVFVNDKLLYACNIRKFAFDQTTYVNALIDYELYITKSRTMLMTKQLKHNHFPSVFYHDGGVLKDNSPQLYTVRIVLTDFSGNKNDYIFFLDAHFHQPLPKETDHNVLSFNCETENIYTFADNSTITIPKGALYADVTINESPNDQSQINETNRQSKYYIPQSELIPLHKDITVRLNLNPIPQYLRSKAVILRNGASLGGKVDGNHISTNSSFFGTFSLAVDTVAPSVKPRNFKDNARLSPDVTALQLTINDDLSGIASYNAYLNGRWILLEYDGKRSAVTLDLNEMHIADPVTLVEGRNTLKIEVADRTGNITTKEYTIIK